MRTLLLLAAFSVALPTAVDGKNVYDEAQFMGAKTFVSHVKDAGLAALLQNPKENLTVFAPTEVAFSQLPQDVRDRLKSDPAFLKQLISFHVVEKYQSINTNNAVFTTMSGNNGRVNVYTEPNTTTISGSPILLDNIQCSNGMLHILSRVMYPFPTGTALDLVCGDDFSMLMLALSKAEITSLLEAPNITLFAPTNKAFESLPTGVFADLLNDIPQLTKVLQNHLLSEVLYSAYVEAKGSLDVETQSGQKLNVSATGKESKMQIGNAMVTSPDINVNNGVVQVIDTVLLLPKTLSRNPTFRVVH